MEAIKVAVIGAGQIGSRHIQAMTQIDRSVIIQAVDPSKHALKTASVRLSDSNLNNSNVRSIAYFSDIAELDGEIDVAIVSTNADVRKDVIKKLLHLKKVKYMILEKVLFQDFESFEEVSLLLKKYGVQAWVNCPIRTNHFFRELKQSLISGEKIDYHVSGGNLGIGCNSIHHVDLLSYLTDDTDFIFTTEQLDPFIIPSKRKGFIEFSGTLNGYTSNNNSFRFTSYTSGQAPLTIHLTTPERIALIRMFDGIVWMAKREDQWIWKQECFSYLHQSQLTHSYIEQILDTGRCYLTAYEESWKLHKPLLRALLHHYNAITQTLHQKCPIT